MDQPPGTASSAEEDAERVPWRVRLNRYLSARVVRPGLARPPHNAAIMLGCVSLASGCAAVLLARSPLLGSEVLIGADGHRVSRVTVIALLITTATACWALGITAIAARKAPRLWLAALVIASAGIAANIHTAALRIARALSDLLTAYPSVDLGITTVPLWALLAASASIMAAAVALVVPLRQLTARPVVYGLVVSAPAWAALLVWAGLSHARQPASFQAAPRRIRHRGAERTPLGCLP